LFESIVNAVGESSWTYVIVFVIAALDAFFPIVPSEATAIAAGVVAGAGELRVEVLILAASLGAIVGDNISFGLGHFLGDRVVNRFFKGEKSQKRLAWAQKTLDERGHHPDHERQQAVQAVDPGARGIVVGRKKEDLDRADDEQGERVADPLPLPRPGAERRQEDEQLGRMDEEAADDAVGVERALAGPHRVGGDEVRLQEDGDHDERREHEVDPQEGSSHAREPMGRAG
jgi:hypothetical protein